MDDYQKTKAELIEELQKARRQSAELKQAQGRLLIDVMEAVAHPFCVIDANDYTVVLDNGAFRRLGSSKGSTCHEKSHGSSTPCASSAGHTCPLEEVKKTRQPVMVEHVHQGPDGEPRFVEVFGYPVLDAEGDVIQLIEYCFDVTSRKQLEQEREKLVAEMGKRIKELQCTYGVSNSIRERSELADVLQDTAALIPPGWTHPELARCKITLDGEAYLSGSFEETEWKQTSDLVIGGERRGAIEVSYLEQRPILDEGPFLQEERELLDGIARDLSLAIERKQSEEALRASEEKIRAIFDASPDVMHLLDNNGTILSVNSAFAARMGLAAEECVGRSVFDFSPDASIPGRRAAIEEVIRTGEPAQLDDRGVTGLFESYVHPVFGPAGEVTALAVYARDITERRRAEQALRASEEKLRVFMESATEGFVTYDSDLNLQSINRTALEVFPAGSTEEKLRGRHILEVAPSLGETGRYDAYVNVVRTGRAVHFDDVVVDPRFGDRRLSIRAFKVGDGLGIILVDITERTKMQTELASFFRVSANLMCVASPTEGRFTKVNPACERILGRSAEELCSRPFEYFIHPDDHEPTRAIIAQLLQGQPATLFENRFRHQDGSYRWLAWTATPAPDAGPVFAVATDITERRSLQASLAQADRMASMGTLAAGVAHEINNPLTYVLYNLQGLAEDLPAVTEALTRLQLALGLEKTREVLGDAEKIRLANQLNDLVNQARDAEQGARRIQEIVRDLRTFSRVDEERHLPVSLNDVIEGAISICHNEIKYRARLIRQYGELPTLMANDGKLAQVFLNVLVNATHAITEGDVEHNEIRVRTWVEDKEVVAEVRDTGKGIAAEDLPRLFEPFFTTKEIGSGSGLGLSICDNIIGSYGGTIDVESEQGQGASFMVRLPIAAESAIEAVRTSDESSAGPPSVRGHVLVVDDERHIGEAIKRMLADEHDVAQVTSGGAAKRVIEEQKTFDAIICDLMMPDVTGMDLHAWLVESNPDLADKMLFVTGGAFTPVARAFIKRVKNPRLGKPFDPQTLRDWVRKMVSRQSV